MNDDPTETRVLYAKLIDNEALEKMVDEIVDYYNRIGKILQ